jgi:hypothetical protein
MSINSRERIISYLRTNGQVRVHDLVRALSPLGRVAIHRNLKKLVEEGMLRKIGKPPLVFYLLAEKKTAAVIPTTSDEVKRVIEQDYLYITPQGEILPGFSGFIRWATNTKQADKIAHLANLYVKTRATYDKYRSPKGWIDATFKLKETFPMVYLDKLFYADFYSLPQFGKTKLGTMMLYAKQSQNRELAKDVSLKVKPLAESIIKKFNINSLAYIPPSIPRNIQFMDELTAYLALPLPHIDLVKTRTGQVIVAQKTLEKLEERVVNARDTIFVKGADQIFKTVLLIDDAVGSGASMNETAKKLIDLKVAQKVIGFAIAGSFKGFEVIREV